MTAATPTGHQRFLDATHQTVAWFWKRLNADELELQPPFQRNPVWQEAQKAYLIDTILRGYPVPEIYVQSVVSADGNEKHIVVDGQQRIRACMEFLDGRFALPDDSTLYPSHEFEDLDDDVKERIFKYKFVVRSLPALSDGEIREIFGRLNRNNVVLNAQELRHATYWGEFISCMTQLSQHAFWVKSGLFTSNDIRRMLDIEYVSELAVAFMFGPQNKRIGLTTWYARFEEDFPDRPEVEQAFNTILAELEQVLPWPNRFRWSRKVDFYSLFLTLAPRVGDMPLDRTDRENLSERLKDFSRAVSRVLSLVESDREQSEEPREAVVYARGVRNSSDLGSRRLRVRALSEFLWPAGTNLDSDDLFPVETAEEEEEEEE